MSKVRLLVLVSVIGLTATLGAVVSAQTFSDVPPSHPFFDEIEWMAANNISTGYADGTYKPSADVTRQAMSAFMQRMAENLLPRAASAASNDLPNDATTTLSTTIEAPAPGVLVMAGSVDITKATAGSDTVTCSLQVDGATVVGSVMFVSVAGDANVEGQCATTAQKLIDAGSYQVTIRVAGVGGATSLYDGNVSVLWVPHAGDGTPPNLADIAADQPQTTDEKTDN